MKIDTGPGLCGCGCGTAVKKHFSQGHVRRLIRSLSDAHRAREKVTLNGAVLTAEEAARRLLSGASLERFVKNTYVPDHPIGSELRVQVRGWNHRATVAALDDAGEVSEVRFVDKRGLMRVTDRFSILS